MVSNTVDDIGSQPPHDFSEKVLSEDYLLRAPSCTKPASYFYSCYCGACGTETFEEGEPVHSFGTSFSFDEENHWYECALCGEKKELAAHEWDEGEVESEANCTEDGVKVYSCDCGATKEEITAAHHTLVFVPELAPTCALEGNVAHWQCSAEGCGKKFADENAKTEVTNVKTPKVDHVYSTWTFDEDGHAKKCTWCELTKDSASHVLSAAYDAQNHFNSCECGYVTDKEAHNVTVHKNADVHWNECGCGYVSAKAAHSNEVRYSSTQHWEACAYCDFALERSAHEYDEGIVTKEATCTEYGTKTFSCACGSSYSEKIAPAHKYSELIPMVDSSCTAEGTKAHYVCLVCEMRFINTLGVVDSLTIPMKEHAWVLGFDSEEGHFEECSVCLAKKLDENGEIILNAHVCVESEGDEVEHFDACECGYVTNNEAHFWGNGVVTVPAECFAEGEKIYTCYCGKTKTEVIPCHSMTFVEAKEVTTCEDGNVAYLRCDVCQNTYYAPGATADNHDHLTLDDIVIPATHDFENGVVEYNENGHWSVCAACGTHSAITAHTTERTGPDADGYFWFECKDCDHKKKADN
jgi:hypothetical protein